MWGSERRTRHAPRCASGALPCWRRRSPGAGGPHPGAVPTAPPTTRPRRRSPSTTVGSLHPVWSAATDGPAGDPVTSTTGVHVEGTDRVYGFRTDGVPRWSVPVPGGHGAIADFTSVLVDGDRVLAVHEGLESTEWVPDANAGAWLDAATGAAVGPGITADGLRDGLAAGSHSLYLDGIYGEILQVADTATGEVRDGGLLSMRSSALRPRRRPTSRWAPARSTSRAPACRPTSRASPTSACGRSPARAALATAGPPRRPTSPAPTGSPSCTGTSATPVVVSADQQTLYLGVDSTLHALDAATGRGAVDGTRRIADHRRAGGGRRVGVRAHERRPARGRGRGRVRRRQLRAHLDGGRRAAPSTCSRPSSARARARSCSRAGPTVGSTPSPPPAAAGRRARRSGRARPARRSPALRRSATVRSTSAPPRVWSPSGCDQHGVTGATPRLSTAGVGRAAL